MFILQFAERWVLGKEKQKSKCSINTKSVNKNQDESQRRGDGAQYLMPTKNNYKNINLLNFKNHTS